MAEEKKKTTKRVKKEPKKVLKEEKEVEIEKEVVTVEEDKEKGNYFRLWEVIVVMIVTAVFGLFIGGYFTYQRYNNRKVSCREIRKDLKEVTNVYDGIVNDYYGEVDKQSVLDGAIKGMLSKLDDRYAAFIDSKSAIELNQELSGKFIGLGVQISGNDNGQIEVRGVFNNSPAYKSGIMVGDIILKVDSVEYNSNTLEDLVYSLKSSEIGDTKKIEIQRNGEVINIEVTLEEVELDSVTHYSVERNGKLIGIITLSNFADNTADQLVKNYQALKEDGVGSIVIDLRGNGGGYLTSAEQVTSLFLDKGMIIYQKTDGEKSEKIENNKDKVVELPVVLLVDYSTASSAEVFVSSLRDNLGATIVGTRTYGKGMIQKLQSLESGSYIKYSTQEWLTPNGNKVEGVGIIPDVEIEYDINVNYDIQLEKAIDVAANK